MGDENPICTLGDYSKPTMRATGIPLSSPNWLERLPAGSITTWEDLTTHFLAQFFPTGRTTKLRNDIMMFQQHHEESLSEAWTHVPSTSDRRLIELENQVQRLMKAHLAPTQLTQVKPTQVNKITTPCEICSGPHDTQNCMENPEQAFVEYASSRTDEVGEGLVSEFMESQDARLSKFEADFKRQQGEMTNKTDIVLKAITDQIVGKLHSDTVKNLKLGTYPVSSTRSYPIMDPQCSTQIHSSINAITIHPKQPDESQVRKLNLMLQSLGLVPQSSNTKFICSKEDDGEVMFIKIIRDDDEPQNEDPNEGEGATTEETVVEYFDTFPTRNELTYHRRLLDPSEDANGGIINFTRRIKGMHVFIGNFTYVVDFMIVKDISSIIDPRTDEVSYKMPHKIEQYDSLSDLEKEHTKSVYLRNEEDKRRGVEYVMSKILAFYKECLELGPEYLTRMDDEGEITYGRVTSSLATRLINKEKCLLRGNPI
ncbi:MAK10-like protein [Tanacetum coccineum]